MDISIRHPHPDTIKAESAKWLMSLLDTPGLSGQHLPSYIRGYIFIDGVPRALCSGSWQISSDLIYLARSGDHVPMFTKLAILTAIGNMTGALDNNMALVEKLSTRLVAEIRASTMMIHGLMLTSAVKPTRLAVDQVNCRVAADLNGSWFLPGGAPVEVDNTWIIMDF